MPETRDYCITFWKIYDELCCAIERDDLDEIKRLQQALSDHRAECKECPAEDIPTKADRTHYEVPARQVPDAPDLAASPAGSREPACEGSE